MECIKVLNIDGSGIFFILRMFNDYHRICIVSSLSPILSVRIMSVSPVLTEAHLIVARNCPLRIPSQFESVGYHRGPLEVRWA